MKVYPIGLSNSQGSLAVIVGGGKIAARKLISLWETDFHIKIISPNFCSEVINLTIQDRSMPLQLIQRKYQNGDLQSAFLVIAATDDHTVNETVWQEAMQEKSLINMVDDTTKSNFCNLAVIKRSQLTIAISSGGACPALVAWLRNKIETCIETDFDELLEMAAQVRIKLLSQGTRKERTSIQSWDTFNTSLLTILTEQGIDAAKQFLATALQPPP